MEGLQISKFSYFGAFHLFFFLTSRFSLLKHFCFWENNTLRPGLTNFYNFQLFCWFVAVAEKLVHPISILVHIQHFCFWFSDLLNNEIMKICSFFSLAEELVCQQKNNLFVPESINYQTINQRWPHATLGGFILLLLIII